MSAAPPTFDESTALPTGLKLVAGGTAPHLRRRSWRTKHLIFAAMILPLDAWLAAEWMRAGFTVPLLIVSLFAASMSAQLLAMFIQGSDIRVADGRLTVHHGPLPSPGMPTRTVDVAAITALRSGASAHRFHVVAVLRDGSEVSLVDPASSAAQAAYIRDVLAAALGVEARGEPRATAADEKYGAIVAAAVLPLGLIAIAASFWSGISSSAEGSLQLRGGDGPDLTFSPDRCVAGSTRGFFGAELTASDAPGVVVRVIRDPVRGSVVAVERNGRQPEVFGRAQCSRLELQVVQTRTNINGVWAVDGSADVACERLAGRVSFSTCH